MTKRVNLWEYGEEYANEYGFDDPPQDKLANMNPEFKQLCLLAALVRRMKTIQRELGDIAAALQAPDKRDDLDRLVESRRRKAAVEPLIEEFERQRERLEKLAKSKLPNEAFSTFWLSFEYNDVTEKRYDRDGHIRRAQYYIENIKTIKTVDDLSLLKGVGKKTINKIKANLAATQAEPADEPTVPKE